MLNDRPRLALMDALRRHGDSLLDDPDLLDELLTVALPNARRDRAVLVDAARERVPAALHAAPAGVPSASLLATLVQRLRATRGLHDDAARWAVATWAEALGVPIAGSIVEHAQDAWTTPTPRVADETWRLAPPVVVADVPRSVPPIVETPIVVEPHVDSVVVPHPLGTADAWVRLTWITCLVGAVVSIAWYVGLAKLDLMNDDRASLFGWLAAASGLLLPWLLRQRHRAAAAGFVLLQALNVLGALTTRHGVFILVSLGFLVVAVAGARAIFSVTAPTPMHT